MSEQNDLEGLLPEEYKRERHRYEGMTEEQLAAVCDSAGEQEWAELLDWYDTAATYPSFLPFAIKVLTRNPLCLADPDDANDVMGLASMALKKLITDYDNRKAQLKEMEDNAG
jgi:hypothetical protein